MILNIQKVFFSTLIDERESHDPHKCSVLISSSYFDFNSFHLLHSSNNISTIDEKDSWFQVEFPQGKVILNGCRLKRDNKYIMKSYKIICTDDINKPDKEWTTLIKIDEKSENEHDILDIYEFSQPSPPTTFVRIIQTGPKWNNSFNLTFSLFDLFGFYI